MHNSTDVIIGIFYDVNKYHLYTYCFSQGREKPGTLLQSQGCSFSMFVSNYLQFLKSAIPLIRDIIYIATPVTTIQ